MARRRYAGYSPKSRSKGQALNMHEIMHLIISLQMLFGSRRGGTGIILAILLVLAVIYFLSSGFLQGVIQADPNKALAKADALWDQDRRPEAVTAYKELLRKPDPIQRDTAWLQDSRPRLYRRIITFEARYGDRQDARDWINDAWNEGIQDLRFDFDEPRELWEEETKNLRGRSTNPLDDLIPDRLK